jgi:SAM-dependent methyltransferase
MTVTTGDVGAFSGVDRTPDAGWFIAFMDAANTVPGYRMARAALAQILGDLQGARVLDVGSGTGDDARELATRVGAHGQVVGIDLSEAMVAEARRRSAGTDLPTVFERADMTRLPYRDGSFDGVRAKLVRQHCHDLDAGDDELVRVLRPGGRVAVFDYDFETLTVDHPDREMTREIARCFADGHEHGWNGRRLRRDFAARGIKDVEITPHTVILPFRFFRQALEGQLERAQADGRLARSVDELGGWWEPLTSAAAAGDFFASLTGFVLGGTR